MSTEYRGLLAVLLSTALMTGVWGQDRGSGPSGPARGDSSSRGPSMSSSSAPAVSSTSRGTSPSRASVMSDSGSSTFSSPGGAAVSGGGTSGFIPVQTYSPQVNYNYWNNCYRFSELLSLRYGFWWADNYLWRYAQGDSPLTMMAVKAALGESSSAATGLVRLSNELETIIARYESGELSRREFDTLVADKTQQIRKLAKSVRKDYFIDFIDQRSSGQSAKYERAASIDELKVLAAELRGLASEMNAGISALHENDRTRVISVNELKQPSFESLAKNIDKLAKTIDKSADAL